MKNDGDSAVKHREFYDEYLAVMDLTAEFYLQTVDTVFIRHLLPKGEMVHRGEPVDLIVATAEGLDHAHAGQILLHDGVDGIQLLLHRAEEREGLVDDPDDKDEHHGDEHHEEQGQLRAGEDGHDQAAYQQHGCAHHDAQHHHDQFLHLDDIVGEPGDD